MRKLAIFDDFTDAELDLLSVVFRCMEYQAGEFLYKEGEPGSFFLVLVSGSVGIYRGTDERMRRLNVVSTGGLLGEISVIDGGLRMATAKAELASVFLMADRADFQRLFEAKSRFAYKLLDVILRDLSTRIRESDQELERIMSREDPSLDQLLASAQQVQTSVNKATDTQRIYKMRQKNLVG
jgi:CRP-like cAMP-binding protein